MNEQPFIRSVMRQFRLYKKLGETAIARLSPDQLNDEPCKDCNSVAVIIRHLHGNMLSRWTDFLTTDGEKPNRQRDAEFESHDHSKEQLLKLWEEGWSALFAAITPLTETDLQKTIHIRSEPMSAMEAIHRQVAHYAYHVGQMVYLGKMMLGENWESLSIPKKK